MERVKVEPAEQRVVSKQQAAPQFNQIVRGA
jgi:hypothetical protein